jgi:hypothetical protein
MAVEDADVLAAHDLVYASVLCHRDGGCMGRLSEVLLGRGVVPKPLDYGGEWWLWWPKGGRGPCRDCGKVRSLTRYSARFGKEYRYLCARCRAAERDRDTQQAQQLWARVGTLSRSAQAGADGAPSSDTGSDGAQERAAGSKPVSRPSDQEWDGHVVQLHELLASLEWAGFDLPEFWDTDWDPQTGALLFSEIWRGDGCVVVEYRPHEDVVAL